VILSMNLQKIICIFFLILIFLTGCPLIISSGDGNATIIEFTGISPSNGETVTANRPELLWNSVEEASIYQLRLSETESFDTPLLISIDFLGTNNLDVYFNLTAGEYFWKVRAEIYETLTNWSPVYSFTVEEEQISGGEVFKFNSTFDSKNIYSIAHLDDGGVLFAGYNNDGGTTAIDLWFGKLSAAGDLSWQYSFPQDDYQQWGDISLWGENYVLTGAHNVLIYDHQMQPLLRTNYTFWSGNENSKSIVRPIDETLLFYVTQENSHRFAATITANGDRQWAKDISIGDRDYVEEAVILSDGGIIIAGKTDYVEGSFTYDGLLTRLDNGGEKVWEYTYGQTGEEYFEDVIELSDGSLFVIGSTETEGAGGSDLWLLNIDASDGTIIDQWTLGEGKNDYGCAVLQETPGSVIIAGEKSFTSYQNTFLWLMKLNLETGLFLWQKSLGEANDFSSVTDLSPYGDGYIISAHDSLIKTDETGNFGSLTVNTNISLSHGTVTSSATGASSGENYPGVAVPVSIDLIIPDITMVKTVQ